MKWCVAEESTNDVEGVKELFQVASQIFDYGLTVNSAPEPDLTGAAVMEGLIKQNAPYLISGTALVQLRLRCKALATVDSS